MEQNENKEKSFYEMEFLGLFIFVVVFDLIIMCMLFFL